MDKLGFQRRHYTWAFDLAGIVHVAHLNRSVWKSIKDLEKKCTIQAASIYALSPFVMGHASSLSNDPPAPRQLLRRNREPRAQPSMLVRSKQRNSNDPL